MRYLPLLTCVIAATLAGCGQPSASSVGEAWVRLPAVPGRPGAAYFTLTGGRTDATLIAVSTPAAHRAELHESMANGMRPTASVALAAGTRVTFAPGGRHVMLFDLNPRLAPGATVPLTVSLADGHQLTTPATVVGAADPAP